MNIFHFDENGVFYAQGLADESPLEPGVFILPANSTDIPPPQVPSEHLAIFHDDQWSIQPIHAAAPDAHEATLEELKSNANIAINVARAMANSGTFSHASKAFACDSLSRGDIDGVNGYVALTGGLPPCFLGAWKAVDNSYLPIADVAAWTAFYADMVAAGAANFAHAQQLKSLVAAANTAAEVAAIVW